MIKILSVKAGKLSTGTRNDSVGNQFDRLKGDRFGNDVDGVDDVIAPRQ